MESGRETALTGSGMVTTEDTNMTDSEQWVIGMAGVNWLLYDSVLPVLASFCIYLKVIFGSICWELRVLRAEPQHNFLRAIVLTGSRTSLLLPHVGLTVYHWWTFKGSFNLADHPGYSMIQALSTGDRGNTVDKIETIGSRTDDPSPVVIVDWILVSIQVVCGHESYLL